MQYFAGLFDAEGCVTLNPKGGFTISIEMANEFIPNLFKEVFKGSIYTRERENRKRTWTWKINSISMDCINFIDSIIQFSVCKKSQLMRLRDYLDQPRDARKHTREKTRLSLIQLKQPILKLTDILPRIPKECDSNFFQWLAGFIDGDGNIVCCYTKQGKFQVFDRQLSIANIFLEPIAHINDRIPGTITPYKRTANIVYKWVPNRSHEKFIYESILPFLKLKKKHCELILEFSSFPKKRRGVPVESTDRRFEIINQIKHLNSL